MQVLMEEYAGEDQNKLDEEHDFRLMAATIGANFKDYPNKPASKKKRIANGKGQRDVAYDSDLPAFVARTILPREARERKDCEEKVLDEYAKLRGKF